MALGDKARDELAEHEVRIEVAAYEESEVEGTARWRGRRGGEVVLESAMRDAWVAMRSIELVQKCVPRVMEPITWILLLAKRVAKLTEIPPAGWGVRMRLIRRRFIRGDSIEDGLYSWPAASMKYFD